MPLVKRTKAMRVFVVVGVVITWMACADQPPTAPEPVGKATASADADSTAPAVVSFADANLELAVRRTLKKPEGPLTTDDLASLTRLDVEWQDVPTIHSLAGLEHATALDTLNLYGNQISDLSPLAGLTNLTFLNLGDNQVTDVAPLAGLTNLRWLSLWGNEVADVSPLAGLTDLTFLNLWGNEVAEVAPLAGLTDLRMLNLSKTQVEDVAPLDSLTALDWLGLVDTGIRGSDLADQVPTLVEKDVTVSLVLSQPEPAVQPQPEPQPEPQPLAYITRGPTIVSIPSRDSDEDNAVDTYAENDIIEIEVGFSQLVCRSGYIELTFQTGSGLAVVRNAWARRCGLGIDGRTTSFEYQVSADDMDGDGVSIAANAIRFESGVNVDLSHAAVPSQANHRVDGSLADMTPPQLSGTPDIVSVPEDGHTFRRDEVIWVMAEFSENLIVDTAGGSPTIGVEIGSFGSDPRPAEYDESSGRRLYFAYTVQADDFDFDGVIWVRAGTLIIPIGSSITDEAGNDADLSWSVSSGTNYRVDGRPSVPEMFFADANLEGAVRQALNQPTGALTATDLESLTELEASSLNIQNLTGLENATALTRLDLSSNQDLADVSPLTTLTNLETLDLGFTGITDAGVASLTTLTNLEWLHLGGTGITDAGVASLTTLTNLETLGLGGTGITDAGVASLTTLTNLEWLSLGGTGITDTGVASLTTLTNLEYLGLRATAITDAGVASLTTLTNLETLDLDGTGITDTGVSSLASTLTNLEWLELGGTGITDTGVSSLASSLTSLTDLRLGATSITDVSPLLSLTNLAYLDLRGITTLNEASLLTHIPALEAAGVRVSR